MAKELSEVSMSLKRVKIDELTGLRGILALFIIHHADKISESAKDGILK